MLCTGYTARCTGYTVLCTGYTVLCTGYTVLCTGYKCAVHQVLDTSMLRCLPTTYQLNYVTEAQQGATSRRVEHQEWRTVRYQAVPRTLVMASSEVPVYCCTLKYSYLGRALDTYVYLQLLHVASQQVPTWYVTTSQNTLVQNTSTGANSSIPSVLCIAKCEELKHT